jgi:hypothetical protein
MALFRPLLVHHLTLVDPFPGWPAQQMGDIAQLDIT